MEQNIYSSNRYRKIFFMQIRKTQGQQQNEFVFPPGKTLAFLLGNLL